MKKLLCLLLTLLCCAALATTAYADLAVSPFESPSFWVLIVAVLPVLAFLIYVFVHKPKQ